jgi:hypothetical protein
MSVRRCYDGCWDSESQREFDTQDSVLAKIRQIEPDAHCTRFPSESVFQVHVWGKPLSAFRASRLAALEEALTSITRGKP